MEIKIREVNGEWAVDMETPDQIQSIYFKSRQNALSFVKYLELADNVIKLDKKELQAPMTNYDRIKAMSVEEMAEFICGIFDIQPDDSKFINGDLIPMYDENEIWQWLESEVSE